jgi:hypothetical protein
MNSLQLIQAACRKWLTVPDQTALDIAATQDLLDSLSLTQGEVWRQLPAHYRRQQLSFDFYGPATGVLTVNGYGSRNISGVVFPAVQDVITYQGDPLFYEGEPLLFNGGSILENPRYYCSILINGDANVNRFNGTSIIHPYLGQTIGEETAVVWHDTKLCPVMVERVISPMVDRLTGRVYRSVQNHSFVRGMHWCHTYSLSRRLHAGVMRTVIELGPQHDQVAVLSCDALVAPLALSLGSAQRPMDLPYDDETAAIIVNAAGAYLRMHPKFNPERTASDTTEAAQSAFRQLSLLSPLTNNQGVQIGTPAGW